MRGYGLGSSNSLKDLHEGICRKTANIVLETTSRKIQINGPEKNKKLSSGLQHTSVTQNDWVRQMLFPVESDGVFQTKLRTINYKRGLFDYKLNYEQLQAVNSVCANEYGTLPFLISGPPGTGKTKSLVELALQLLNTTQIAHILICAPSEAAADTLAQRLRRQLSPHQLLRLNGPGRDDKEVPGDLMQYCYIESEMFYLPPFKKLMQYNVVVTTTRDAAILAEARLTNADLYHIETSMLSAFHPEDTRPPPSLHWGALLMDEAAQATELEALVPISVIIPPSSYPKDLPQPRFVMAGDQNQLGPRTASRNPGFSKSLFARLFDRPVYSNHPLSRSKVRPSASPPVLEASMLPMLYPPFVNLVHNYRSHPAILSIPSTLFYNDTLIPETPIPQTALQVSNLWQGRRWPLLYIPHAGLDEIERDGGGWYNVSEARVACNIAQYLVTYDMVRQSDICIMSPFAAQVRMLRAMIRGSAYGGGSGLWEVNIGPLEAFQGLESRTVIICTTRTRARFLEPDRKRGLGVVGERRKMNVAVTRAKEALIVIGSPEVLARDEWWKEWVSFCSRNGLVGQGDREGIGMRVFEEEKKKGTFEGGKVGVLEKALLVKEKREQETAMGNQKRTLGGASAGVGIVGEDEMWEAGLKAALEGWGDIEEDEYEEGEGEVGNHDEETQSEDEKTNASGSDASAL
ncbi:P-loop containing nucleoside triphosphate hydrolase protein [Lojkania enalia]|uniref:P-loop containing nucleoside triphosphate hydrolase protein n=1 Tax=Lojkania enalia TaxID=147567 RepID=A0A9P4JW20_9PLEO|nr:P-loop containing nucleoside triphosphate hydrolase protein [Didymosphaeria enalia]